MSGARLQALGQVRNVFPYVVSQGSIISVDLVAGALSAEKVITALKELPFDLGPDKSSRVFLSISASFIVQANAYAGPPVLDGYLYYRSPDNSKIYLATIAQSFTGPFALNIDKLLTPAYSYNANNLTDIGYIGFEDNATALGGAATITIKSAVNIGLYGDFSEPDWCRLFETAKHEHTGLSALREPED